MLIARQKQNSQSHLEGDEVTKSGDVTDGGGDLSEDDVDKVVAASVTSGARQTGTRSVLMSTAD